MGSGHSRRRGKKVSGRLRWGGRREIQQAPHRLTSPESRRPRTDRFQTRLARALGDFDGDLCYSTNHALAGAPSVYYHRR